MRRMSEEAADKPYMRLDSANMCEPAAAWMQEITLLLSVGNVYAPLYRQMNGAVLAQLDSAGFEAYTSATPQEDVFAAFDYHLTNINKGERPFLLYGNSQGAQLVVEVATRLLSDDIYSQYNELHIATYAIGCPVTGADIARNPALRFATGATDTGVLLSWNTVAPSEIATGAYSSFGTWKDGALTINPISWCSDEVLAYAADNATSYIPGEDGELRVSEHYANAIVDGEHGVLTVTTADESVYPAMLPTISKFHRYDIAFFYDSIGQNIQDRVAAFLSNR